MQQPAISSILQCDRYSMNEAGIIMEGNEYSGFAFRNSKKRQAIKNTQGSSLWTTIIECISASGQVLTPFVIFKGETVQQEWFSEDPQYLDFIND